MQATSLNAKLTHTRLRTRWIPIGFAILLLGLAGLIREWTSISEDATLRELLVTYDEGIGFAPYLIQVDNDPAIREIESETTAAGAEDVAGSIHSAADDPMQTVSLLGGIPNGLVIPSIGLDAPIVPVGQGQIQLHGETYNQWLAPRGFLAGWHDDSSLLGLGGNTVINGHHNAYGEVFQDLIDVQENDTIFVNAGEDRFQYVVTDKLILEERFASVEERLANAAWIEPTDDDRLTLITCWPATSNTHRLIIIAKPLGLMLDAQTKLPQ